MNRLRVRTATKTSTYTKIIIASTIIGVMSIVGFTVGGNTGSNMSGAPVVQPAKDFKVIDIEGEFEHWHADSLGSDGKFIPAKARHSFSLKTSDGKRVQLIFADHPPKHILSGTQVRVHGFFNTEGAFIPQGGAGSVQVLKDVRVNTLKKVSADNTSSRMVRAAEVSPRRVAVILINFQNDRSQPVTIAQVQQALTLNTRSAKNYYHENSFGDTILAGVRAQSGDVFGWYTIPENNTGCIQYARDLWGHEQWGISAELAAGRDGFQRSSYDHVVYVMSTSDCPFAGAAFVGDYRSWVQSSAIAGGHGEYVIAHELGHNFGVVHANSIKCTDSSHVPVAIDDNCVHYEYGDPFDLMGGGFRHMNGYFKAVLGSYQDPHVLDVATSGTYTIAPIERRGNTPHVLRVVRERDGRGQPFSSFYIEYRQPNGGFDDFQSTDSAVKGIQVRLVGRNGMPWLGTELLDMTPATQTMDDAVLMIGQTFRDPRSGLQFKTVSITPSAATVQVTVPPILAQGLHVSVGTSGFAGTPLAGEGAPSGRIISQPGGGIQCEPDCSEWLPAGSQVTLTAVPGAGSVFDGWDWDVNTACARSNDPICPVVTNGAMRAVGFFSRNMLHVAKEGSGTGFVMSNPVGISCGTDCSKPFRTGAQITLTAVADAGSEFVGWSGGCSGVGPCTVSILRSVTNVVAHFERQLRTVTVTTTPGGVVQSEPVGISCGSTCSTRLMQGSTIVLHAIPKPGYSFNGWYGACAGYNQCALTLDNDKEVRAEFIPVTGTVKPPQKPIQPPTITIPLKDRIKDKIKP